MSDEQNGDDFLYVVFCCSMVFFAEYDLPARVPGGIYSDLLNYGIISDFFAGYGDVATRWVALKNWTFRVNFSGKILSQ